MASYSRAVPLVAISRANKHRVRTQRRAGFSLASILLLTVVVAVFAAGIGIISTHPQRVHEGLFVVGTVVGGFVGVIVGAVIGSRQIRPDRGILVGSLAGWMAGAGCGAMLAVPISHSLLVIIVGSLVMICFGLVVRYFSADPPGQ